MPTPNRAIILAAGRSTRLLPDTVTHPKTLLPIGPQSLLEHQIESLRSVGVDDIAVVTGHGSEYVRNLLGDTVTFFHNDRYLETSSLYSLWMAQEFGRNGCLILNSDVLFDTRILTSLLEAEAPEALMVDFCDGLGEEEMKVIISDGAVVEISKNIAPALAHGENLGIVKIGQGGAEAVFDAAAAFAREGQWAVMVPHAVRALIGKRPFAAISCGDFPWIEIDYHHDLERARNEIYPRIAGARP